MQFVQEAIQSKLLRDAQIEIKKSKNQQLLKLIKEIQPIKADYSSVEMINKLRQHHD